ncbi:MAG: DUF167 domain-containing protein [Ignavibacteriales bacterium]|nr:DUF167 domain-containing protein [Ignavibacteriales bacterium]
MRVSIRVRAHARRNFVEVGDDGNLIVSVTAPPVEGKANKKVIEVLSEYLGKPKRNISILRGRSGRHKIVEIL